MRLRTFALLTGLILLAVGAAVLFTPGSPLRVATAPAEGCLGCHAGVQGLDGAHAPARIGCAACHGGDKSARDQAAAHAGLVLIPGNLADAGRTCGQAGCHAAIVPRVERSIMTTMAGVIAVDREALGEPAMPDGRLPHAQRLGHGVADSHLRELCVGCHLGQAKTEWGPINQETQGGGCNACHLEYGPEAAAAVAAYLKTPRAARKAAPAAHPLKPPAAACTEGKGHERLSCTSCHTAWAPRCVTCHTAFDPAGEGFDHAAQKWVPGTWNETAGPFEALPPTLGVLADGRARGAIDVFVPGMVLTFDRNKEAGGKPDVLHRRLYAKLFSHTTRREARSCQSCHADPVALGFGKGELRYRVAGTEGRWQFTPREKPSRHDGLPEDAWTGFLRARTGMVSTREGARPFSPEEQRRILGVGACLTCHAGDSPVMKRALADFPATLAGRSRQCAVPRWAP